MIMKALESDKVLVTTIRIKSDNTRTGGDPEGEGRGNWLLLTHLQSHENMWTVLGSVSDLRVFHAVRLWGVFRMKFF